MAGRVVKTKPPLAERLKSAPISKNTNKMKAFLLTLLIVAAIFIAINLTSKPTPVAPPPPSGLVDFKDEAAASEIVEVPKEVKRRTHNDEADEYDKVTEALIRTARMKSQEAEDFRLLRKAAK
jgi:hypothetical protein